MKASSSSFSAIALCLSPSWWCCHGFSLRQAASVQGNPPRSWALKSTTEATINDALPTNADTSRSAKFWKWKGHDIFTETRAPAGGSPNEKPAVILLHGFGASTTYWRETMSVLQEEGYEVHALDLLGQGRSSKPFSKREYPFEQDAMNGEASAVMDMGENTDTKVNYSIDLWAQLVDDYARHLQLDDVVLMGNSLGSLVCLSAATGDFIGDSADRKNFTTYLAGNSVGEGSRLKGLCLFNCGVGLNSRNLVKNPSFSEPQRAVFNWLFDVFNSLIFDNEWLLRYALNNVVTKELLENALKSLYMHSPDRVDGELVDSFYYPAKLGGDGAIDAIRQIYCNDAGLTPKEYHDKYPEILDTLPLHLIWGLEDAVTPIEGDVGLFYCDRVANNRGGKGMTTIDCIKSGHVPFDDNPVETHAAMTKWLQKKVVR